MNENNPKDTSEPRSDLKEYAGGWMTERKGTDAPQFLKIVLPLVGLFCVSYLVVYMNGEVNHAERGALVRQFNAATIGADGLMYGVAGLTLLYVIAVAIFINRKPHQED